MVQVRTKRPLPIGVTVVKSQTLMELGPEDLVERLSRQGFIETVETWKEREKADAQKLKEKKTKKSA